MVLCQLVLSNNCMYHFNLKGVEEKNRSSSSFCLQKTLLFDESAIMIYFQQTITILLSEKIKEKYSHSLISTKCMFTMDYVQIRT